MRMRGEILDRMKQDLSSWDYDPDEWADETEWSLDMILYWVEGTRLEVEEAKRIKRIIKERMRTCASMRLF